MSENATPRRSRESTRAAWSERLTRFESSGLSVLDFCRTEAVSGQSFYYWRRKLADPSATPPTIPDFLPVRITVAAAPVELVLPGGATLRLSPGCDLSFVRSLVAALAGGSAVKLWYCPSPVDMRLGFDGLYALVTNRLNADPLSGHLFIFRNKASDRLKVLYWGGHGLCLWCQRLEAGRYHFPDAADATGAVELSAGAFQMVLDGIDLSRVERFKRFELPEKALPAG